MSNVCSLIYAKASKNMLMHLCAIRKGCKHSMSLVAVIGKISQHLPWMLMLSARVLNMCVVCLVTHAKVIYCVPTHFAKVLYDGLYIVDGIGKGLIINH